MKKMMMMSPNSSKCTRLCSVQTAMLSIESVKLEITSGNRNRRHIYGDIHINGGHLGKAYSIYHRTSDQPETVSSQRFLTLCGPRYAVHLPHTLYVDLHELDIEIEGGEAPPPFLQTAFELEPILQQHKDDYNVSFDFSITGENGVLTVSMTRVVPSVLTMVQVDLLDVVNPCDAEWLVSGTVTAIQTLPGAPPIKRKLNLLNRPESDPIELRNVPVVNLVFPYRTPSQVIPLDRKFVPAPVRLQSDYVTKMNSLILECGGKPSNLNGDGSSLTIALNLKFKRPRLRCCVMAESREFELSGSDEVGSVYYDYIEGHVRIADKRRRRQRRIDQKIQIKVMLHTLYDMVLDKDDEVLESTLPLYVEEDEDERRARLIAKWELDPETGL